MRSATPGDAGTNLNQPFVAGTPVFDAHGERVGSVSPQPAPDGSLVVQKGWLFPKDVAIPLRVVRHIDAAGVHLSLGKDDLGNHDGDGPTAGTANHFATPTEVRTDQDELRVPVRDEDLVVSTQHDEVGRVHRPKDVHAEQHMFTEPVTREYDPVERLPLQGVYADAPADAFTEQDITIPLLGEQLVISKRAVVTDVVQLHKDALTEQQQISDTVRKERVTVAGAAEVRGADTDTSG